MNTPESNKKVALSMLEDVEANLRKEFEDVVAIAPGAESVAGHPMGAAWAICKDLLKDVDVAEKQFESPGVRAYAAFVRGRIYAIHGTPMGTRGPHKKAIEQYGLALQHAPDIESLVRYFRGICHQMWRDRDMAMDDFARVVELEGTNSERGIDAAKRLARLKEKKPGCASALLLVLLLMTLMAGIVVLLICGVPII